MVGGGCQPCQAEGVLLNYLADSGAWQERGGANVCVAVAPPLFSDFAYGGVANTTLLHAEA